MVSDTLILAQPLRKTRQNSARQRDIPRLHLNACRIGKSFDNGQKGKRGESRSFICLGVDFRACDNYKNGFEAAKQIKIPTLSILATDDKMCPVKEGKKLANLIEGSQIDIIDNCGHMMLLEEADRVLNVLKKFITTNYPANK